MKAADLKNITGFSTKAIHAGQSPAPENGAIMTPIYQTSTFVQSSPGKHTGYEYARTGNPTRTALEKNLAALEGGMEAICFASGCAATDAVLHLLNAGDHILCSDDVYGGTYRLFTKVFNRFGIEVSFVDASDSELFLKALKPETRIVWLETPTNPLLKLADIKSIAQGLSRREALLVVDNTFASPYLQNPLKLGADLVLHSSTKYIGGHSDVVGGVIVSSNNAALEQLRYLQNAVGAVPSPLDCFLLLRSTKTLELRMQRHCENAIKIAQMLERRKDINWIRYPGLESHPQFELAKRQMKAGGGMITFEIQGGLERARSVLERFRVFSLAESLGGVESLVEHPAIMTHASIPADVRLGLGISDGLIRLSVGIEDVDDLLNDLEYALGG